MDTVTVKTKQREEARWGVKEGMGGSCGCAQRDEGGEMERGGGLPGEKCDRQGQCEMNMINLKMGKLQVRLEEFK